MVGGKEKCPLKGGSGQREVGGRAERLRLPPAAGGQSQIGGRAEKCSL